MGESITTWQRRPILDGMTTPICLSADELFFHAPRVYRARFSKFALSLTMDNYRRHKSNTFQRDITPRDCVIDQQIRPKYSARL